MEIKRRRGKRRKTGDAAARPVIAYRRVSTLSQSERGASLAAQSETIAAWAARLGLAVTATFEDVGSGARSDRPGLRAALALACKTGGIVATASLSRLARNAADLHQFARQLETCGAHLASAAPAEAAIDTSTIAGRMTFAVLAALAEMERDFTRERTATVAAHLRRQGRRISGRIPYGYTLAADGKQLTADQDEQAVIEEMRRLRTGGATYRAIVAELASRGILAKQGGAWSPAVVADVLARSAKLAA